MKKILFLLFVFILTVQAEAQKNAQDAVKAVINKLFAAMKASDANSFEACFAKGAILQTVTETGQVKTENLKAFIKEITSMPKDSADERITFDVVKVDNNLAVAWTPYEFYYADKFVHCGADSFQLVRENGQWKIQYIIDTRRKKGCR
jgi:hypothetical protein